jgi:hypothetical protein
MADYLFCNIWFNTARRLIDDGSGLCPLLQVSERVHGGQMRYGAVCVDTYPADAAVHAGNGRVEQTWLRTAAIMPHKQRAYMIVKDAINLLIELFGNFSFRTTSIKKRSFVRLLA